MPVGVWRPILGCLVMAAVLTGCSDLGRPGIGIDSRGSIVVFVPVCVAPETVGVTVSIDDGEGDAREVWRIEDLPDPRVQQWFVAGADVAGREQDPAKAIDVPPGSTLIVELETTGGKTWRRAVAAQSLPEEGAIIGSRETVPIDSVDPATFMEDQCGSEVVTSSFWKAVGALGLVVAGIIVGTMLVHRRRPAMSGAGVS